MVSTKWCLMHLSGSVSPKCGCPLSALLLLADWTKASRGHHNRTSSRPEEEPTEIEGFMIWPRWGPWSPQDVKHVTSSLLFCFLLFLCLTIFCTVQVFHPSCVSGSHKGETGCLCLYSRGSRLASCSEKGSKRAASSRHSIPHSLDPPQSGRR